MPATLRHTQRGPKAGGALAHIARAAQQNEENEVLRRDRDRQEIATDGNVVELSACLR